MKTQPPKTEKNFNKDLKTFEQQPAKTKELSLLKDQAEKTTGPESTVIARKIRAKAQQ